MPVPKTGSDYYQWLEAYAKTKVQASDNSVGQEQYMAERMLENDNELDKASVIIYSDNFLLSCLTEDAKQRLRNDFASKIRNSTNEEEASANS